MTIFVKEILEANKSCLICNKDLILYLEGMIYDKSSFAKIDIVFKSKLEDNILTFYNSKFNFSVDIDSNLVVKNKDVFDSIHVNDSELYKSCKTCHYIIRYSRSTKYEDVLNAKLFYKFYKYVSHIRFDLKRDHIVIVNYVNNDPNKHNSILTINKRQLKCDYIDFEKIKDFKALKKRICLLKTFS